MRPFFPWCLVALAALSAHPAVAADLYKCGVPGQIIYTDQPCKNLGATTLDVLTPRKLDQEMLTIVPSGGVTPKPVHVPASAAKLPRRMHRAARHHHSGGHHHTVRHHRAGTHHHHVRHRSHSARRAPRHKVGRVTSSSP